MSAHIQNELTSYVSMRSRYNSLTPEEHKRLYTEIKNATLQKIDDKLVELSKSGEKKSNDVNSLLLWVLELTDDIPIKPQKIKSPGSYADIDVDYPKDKREKVFDYLYDKYGHDRVAHVATFGTLGAKAVVRAASKALGMADVGPKISKHIPNIPEIKLRDAIDSSKELQAFLKKPNSDEAKVIDVSLKLEGLPNSIGVHASACVISDEPLTDYMPLMVAARKDSSAVMTQFEYYDVEALG